MLRTDISQILTSYRYRETQEAQFILSRVDAPNLDNQEVLKIWGLLSDCLDHHRDINLPELRQLEGLLAAQATVRQLPLND